MQLPFSCSSLSSFPCFSWFSFSFVFLFRNKSTEEEKSGVYIFFFFFFSKGLEEAQCRIVIDVSCFDVHCMCQRNNKNKQSRGSYFSYSRDPRTIVQFNEKDEDSFLLERLERSLFSSRDVHVLNN